MSQRKIGPYAVVRELGRGGMGTVYQGISPDGDPVAIKTMRLPADLDSATRWEAVERFQREARACRELQHRNIVRVLDVGEDQGVFYMVQEFLDGQSVGQLLRMAGRMDPQRAAEIVSDVCGALAYAHEHGVVHRDLKPDNLMILKNGTVKLTDFGLASVEGDTKLTQAGTALGTVSYMSPEQARGEKVDARSDIFSLGATFYHMLAGVEPFPGDTAPAVLSKILTEEPAALRGLPPQIARALSRCLVKDVGARFQSAAEIVEALQLSATTMHRPAAATPPPGAAAAKPTKPLLAPAAPKPAAPMGLKVCVYCSTPQSAPKEPYCRKCGRPYPGLGHKIDRKRSEELQREIEQSAEKMAPKKKKWWQVW